MGLLNNLSPIEIIALTIYGEARGEPIEGQIAVGFVIRNRFYSDQTKYKTYNQVCLEPKQFSCWNQDDPNYNILTELAQKMIDGQSIDVPMRQFMFIAEGVIYTNIYTNVGGNRYYLTTRMFDNDRPIWAKNAKNVIIKGNQTFFDV